MSHMVIAYDHVSRLLQGKRHMLVAAHVFSQTMYQQNQRFG